MNVNIAINWLNDNEMLANPKKLIFLARNKSIEKKMPFVEKAIKSSSTVESLVITLDKNLNFKSHTENKGKQLNSGHVRVLKNVAVIKRYPLLGSSLTKIVTFGTKHFVRYSRHARYLGFRYWEISLYLSQKKKKVLFRIQRFLTLKQAKVLAVAYILPNFRYCSLVRMFCGKCSNN